MHKRKWLPNNKVHITTNTDLRPRNSDTPKAELEAMLLYENKYLYRCVLKTIQISNKVSIQL